METDENENLENENNQDKTGSIFDMIGNSVSDRDFAEMIRENGNVSGNVSEFEISDEDDSGEEEQDDSVSTDSGFSGQEAPGFVDDLSGNGGDSNIIEPETEYANADDGGIPDGDGEKPGGSGNAGSGEKNFTTLDSGQEEIKPFKVSASEAMEAGTAVTRKPPVLNKQFILYVIIGVFSVLVVFALFIYPEISKRKKEQLNKKPKAVEYPVPDYSSLVNDSPETEVAIGTAENSPEKEKNGGQGETEEEIIDNLPPVNEKYKPQPRQSQVYYGGGGGYSYEVPDTRSDALQSKSINGIKGITPTQKNYLTPDYTASYPVPGGSAPAASGSSTAGANPAGSNPYAKFGLPSREEYTNQLMSQYNTTQDSYARQNDQAGKNNFYNQNRGNVSGQWLPLNSIWQGTIFDAVLTSDISTDLPGECTAVITKNIYSSQDGRYLLIPQNSKLYGSYNSSISYSQNRVQVGWHTLIRPDGYMINLGNFNATDSKGASGLKGRINDHPFAYLKALALMSAVNLVNSELQSAGASSGNEYVQNVMANSQEIATTLGGKLIDRAMDVQPTITIKAGTIINIVANTTIELPVMEPWEVTEPYRK